MNTTTMSLEKLETPGCWRVNMQYGMSDAQRMELCLNVSMAHPAPRVTDLERLCIQHAQLLLEHMLAALPDRQDK